MRTWDKRWRYLLWWGVAGFAVAFVGEAFAQWSLDPAVWPSGARRSVVFVALTAAVAGALVAACESGAEAEREEERRF